MMYGVIWPVHFEIKMQRNVRMEEQKDFLFFYFILKKLYFVFK